MAKQGASVTVIEKHGIPGGRARQFKAAGFTFDMGPSWYWMPEVFERYFAAFGKRREDLYQLHRLDPSYRVYWKNNAVDIPAGVPALISLFESIESGAGQQLQQFLKEAAFKYQTGMEKLVYKPGLSLLEFADADFIKGVVKLDVFTSMKKHVQKFFKHPQLRQLLEFPVLFLGALPSDIPALYSLMNYADMEGGTWYPEGGIYSVVEAMYQTALEQGVEFSFNEEVQNIAVTDNKAGKVITNKSAYDADAVIVAADYHHAETNWLEPRYRTYSDAYWEKRVMAPSCLLYYVGVGKKLPGIPHHSLFFDTDFDTHAAEIYANPQWPTDPMFYVSTVSVTDPGSAPEGSENLFLLVPVAAGLTGDTTELRADYFNKIMRRLEARLGYGILDHIVYKRSFAVSDFINDYHAFKGNAYGLANTLLQTSILKPSCRSRKVRNLFYTGQLTVPGPGVPPSLISGEMVAGLVAKYLSKENSLT